ncbi:uncharacterized protein DS421_1g10860 [Arachis hypogaea]|nr:uncharacterized protein DS421_1g10860 [Arachis hypogaea]
MASTLSPMIVLIVNREGITVILNRDIVFSYSEQKKTKEKDGIRERIKAYGFKNGGIGIEAAIPTAALSTGTECNATVLTLIDSNGDGKARRREDGSHFPPPYRISASLSHVHLVCLIASLYLEWNTSDNGQSTVVATPSMATEQNAMFSPTSPSSGGTWLDGDA